MAIFIDFDMLVVYQRNNGYQAERRMYQHRHVCDQNIDLTDNCFRTHARFLGAGHQFSIWRIVCEAIPHLLFNNDDCFE